MRGATGALAAVVVVVSLPLIGAAAGHATSRVPISGYGTWSLAALGYQDQTIDPTSVPYSTDDLSFSVDPSAVQDERHWYVVHIHFRITFAPDSGAGLVLVSAALNGRTAIQVVFKPHVTSAGLEIPWSTLDLIHGLRRHVDRSLAIDVTDPNYAQVHSVGAGPNTLTLQLEQYESAKVQSLVVFSDSALECTRLGPGLLGVRTWLVGHHPVARRRFRLRYELTARWDARPSRSR